MTVILRKANKSNDRKMIKYQSCAVRNVSEMLGEDCETVIYSDPWRRRRTAQSGIKDVCLVKIILRNGRNIALIASFV